MKLVVVEIPRLVKGAVRPGEFKLEAAENNPVNADKGQIIFVGRHLDNDLVLADHTVSRCHLAIHLNNENGRPMLTNLSTKGKTIYNQKRLQPGEEVEIKPGDELQLGLVKLEVAALSLSEPTPVEQLEAEPEAVSFAELEPQTDEAILDALVTNLTANLNSVEPEPQPTLAAQTVEEETKVEAVSETSPTSTSISSEPVARTEPVEQEQKKPWFLLSPTWRPWSYLGLLTLAEIVTATVNAQIGLGLHALLLVWLVLHGALGRQTAERGLALAMVVAPLIRLLSLSLPLTSFPQMAWYPMVAAPLLLTAFIIVRQLNLSADSLGIRPGNLVVQLMIASGGMGLGAIEYAILQPAPLVNQLSWEVLILPILSLVIFTGFNEEFVFRGLLQAVSLPVLKGQALIYVSLVFAVLHIGYLSILDVGFVFAVGVLFAYIVKWGGSILGVTMAHGLTNVMLFLIMPYLNSPAAVKGNMGSSLPWLIWVGTLSAFAAIFLLAFKAFRTRITLRGSLKLEA